MERYKFVFACLLVFACIIAFEFATISYALFTPEQETKINAAADSTARAAANPPPHEMKIASFILQRINRMIQENAKNHPEPEKKYSTRIMRVDKAARILVNVALLRGSAKLDTNIVVEKIRAFGGAVKTISNPLSDYPIEIYCWLPYDTVKAIAKLQKVANISGIGIGTTWTGCETTIGDMQLLADQARAYFNVTGSGIKVGVISDGIQHASVSQACGDLPSFLQTVNGNTPGDEGTAMLEIVYDLAPGAGLAFGGINLDGTDGPNDMATRIFDLYQNIGCKIVVDDIGWLSGVPYFSESNLMQQIQAQISSNDKTYVSAAGNHGNACWNGYSFVDGDGWHRFWFQGSNYVIHNPVVVGPHATIDIYLQWANPWGASSNNYDLYLYDAFSRVDSSKTVQDGNDYPEEIISYTNPTDDPITFYIRIKKMFTGNERELKLVVSQPHTLGYLYPNYAGETMPVRQIFGHEASLGAISVGAYASDAPDALAPYSARGKTPIYIFAGQTETRDERTTPTIVATTKVSTKVGIDGSQQSPPWFVEPFEGTSAAAPHVAGIAALYFSKYPSDSHADFYNSLTSYATTLGSIGTGGVHNTQSGFGKANAFATLAKGDFLPVTVSQVDDQSQSFGQVGVYEGTGFVNYSVPHTFSWLENSTQTLRSDQNFKPSTTQKYHDWNQLSDVVNHRQFTISVTTSELTSHFNTANNATIQTQLLDGGSSGGSVEFKDPWLIDDTSDPKGPRNRGLNAVWTSQTSPFSPSTGSSYKGVFLNQDPNIPGNPYYSARVLETQTISGFTSYFQNWVTSGANLTTPNNLVGGYYESPVVFQSAGATVTAKYKAHLGSSSTLAMASNNQRKMVYDGAYYYLVYESGGEIYYTDSDDNGTTWTKEVRISDGNGGNKYPSLDVANQIVIVVWQQEFPSTGKICMRRRYDFVWQSQQEVASFFASPGFTATPVIVEAGSFDYHIVWHDYDSDNLTIRTYKESTSTWSPATAIPSTNSNSFYPALAADTNINLHLACAESGTIYYTKIQFDGSNYTFSPSKEDVSSGTGYSNHVYSSITTDYSRRPNVSWQAYSGPALETQIILHRRRELSGAWSSATAFIGNEEYYKPSITSYPNVTNNQKLAATWWRGINLIWLAKYDGTSWTDFYQGMSGIDPNLSANTSGTEAAKIVWRNGTTSPYAIATTSQNLPKATATHLSHYRRGVMQIGKVELAFEVGDFTLQSGANKIPIALFAYNDTLAAGFTGEWNDMFRTEPVTLPANGEVEFRNGFSLVNPRLIGNALPPGASVNFTLEAVEVSKNIPLAVLHERVVSRNDTLQFRGKRRETVPVTLAGRQVYLRVVARTQGPIVAKPALVEIYHEVADSSGLQRPELADGTSLPQTFMLHTNYPNPFNPETAIRFDLPEASEVVLAIFNSLGESVKTLVNGQRAAGSYVEFWDGRNAGGEMAASGVYFLKMRAKDFSATQKMLLLR
ncbi:MAG: S8 family serine peptidase [bacterium]